MIKLDENFNIVADTYSWCLQRPYIKEVKDKKTKQLKKVDAIEKWWFPKLSDCLNEYINVSSKECKSIDELINHLKEVNKTIERVSKIYVSNGKLIQI